MNTIFLNWCRVLMSKRRVLVLAEMLCLIAVASMSLFVSPLAHAHVEKGVGTVKNVALQPATFQSIVATIVKDHSGLGTTAQVSNHMTLKDLKNTPWVVVTLPVNGKTATFAATAFLDARKRPSVWLAEILPPADPNDANLKPLMGQTRLLIGIK